MVVMKNSTRALKQQCGCFPGGLTAYSVTVWRFGANIADFGAAAAAVVVLGSGHSVSTLHMRRAAAVLSAVPSQPAGAAR